MKKFCALCLIPTAVVEEWKKTTSPEKMKVASDEMMQAWAKWVKDHKKMFVDEGLPLGKTKRVTAENISDIKNDMNWYFIVEAESHEAAAKIFQGHPHLQIPGSSIEVMEIPPMPRMQ